MPDAFYFIAGCHGDDDTGIDGVEVRLDRAGVDALLAWFDRLAALGPDARGLVVAVPAAVTLRWLTGEPVDGSDADYLLDALDPADGDADEACGCPWDLADEPWPEYAAADPPATVACFVSDRGYVGFCGDGDAVCSQGLPAAVLREMRADFRAPLN